MSRKAAKAVLREVDEATMTAATNIAIKEYEEALARLSRLKGL